MSCSGTPQWEAVQNRQPPTPHSIRVSGKPCMPSANYEPVLTRAVPQGINPRVLLLDLTAADTGGVGADVLRRAPVTYEETSNQEYDQVQIRSHVNTEHSATIDVQILEKAATR